MNRHWRFARPVLLVFFIYVLYLLLSFVFTQISFEKCLNSLYITFDDFPKDYSEALKSSLSDKSAILGYNYSSFPSDSTSTYNIPPTIHFIWFKDLYETHAEITDMPSMGSNTPDLCRQYNPDFTINIWNASAALTFLQQNYPEYIPDYNNYRYPIQRIDFLKYFLLWHYGGFYMDLDISCRRSLIPLQQFPAWFPRASPFGVNNDLMASRPKHPVVGKMTQTLKPRNRNLLFPYLTIFWATGPQFTSDVLKMWFSEGKVKEYIQGTNKMNSGKPVQCGNSGSIQVEMFANILSDPDAFYVLPQEFYSEEYTFFGHRPGGTWHGEDVAVILWLVARPWVVILVFSTLLVAWLAIAFRRRRFKKTTYV